MTGDELEILIAPEGIVPVIAFLKDHMNAQYTNLSDITAIDVPQRENRFEVRKYSALIPQYCFDQLFNEF